MLAATAWASTLAQSPARKCMAPHALGTQCVRNALPSRPQGCRGVDGAEPRSFGELLRRFRIEAGLTQEDLAERAGLSARGVQDLERGLRRSPYPATTRRLAEALELRDTERALLFGAVDRKLEGRRTPHPRTGAIQPVEVVLCHAARDRPVVERLAAGLWSAGLVPRVDSGLLAAEQHMRGQTVYVVFLGATEVGAYDLASLGLTPRGSDLANGQRLIPVLLLVTASDDRTARVWAVAPGNLLADACGTVGRNLSADEWQRYLPDQSYRRTCADLH